MSLFGVDSDDLDTPTQRGGLVISPATGAEKHRWVKAPPRGKKPAIEGTGRGHFADFDFGNISTSQGVGAMGARRVV